MTVTLAVVMSTVHVYTPEFTIVTSFNSSPNIVIVMVLLLVIIVSSRENIGIEGPLETQGSNNDPPSYTVRGTEGGERVMVCSGSAVAKREKI